MAPSQTPPAPVDSDPAQSAGAWLRPGRHLLAGLGVLLPMLELLRTHDPDDLRRLADRALPGLLREDSG